jgi:ribosome-binding protein aMBF1 (putative translation factor)
MGTRRRTWEEIKRELPANIETRQGYLYAQRRYELGQQVRSLRKARGLKQTELARMAGLTQAAISRIEAGGVDPELDTLERLGEVLGVKLVVEFREETTVSD